MKHVISDTSYRHDMSNMIPTDVWPEHLKSLKELDAGLRCGICYDYITTAMMVKHCSHNYCSLCIRQYLTFKNECPTCRKPVVDGDLVNNRLVDELVSHFTSAKPALLDAVRGSSNLNNQSNEVSTNNVELPVCSTPSQHNSSLRARQAFPQKTPLSSSTQHPSIKAFCTKTHLPLIEREEILHKPRSTNKRRNLSSSSDSDSADDSDVILCDNSDDDFTPMKTSAIVGNRRSLRVTKSPRLAASKQRKNEWKYGTVVNEGNVTVEESDNTCVNSNDGLILNVQGGDSKDNSRTVDLVASPPSPVFTSVKSQSSSQGSRDQSCTELTTTELQSLGPKQDTACGSLVENQECDSTSQREWWKKAGTAGIGNNEVTVSRGGEQQAPVSMETAQSAVTSTSAAPTVPSTPASSEKVPCPVCNVPVPVRNVNLHLDRCLASSEKKEALRSKTTPVRKKTMPKLVYNLMKDGEIKKKLAEAGLPTQGDRKKLIGLHKDLTLRFNAQCDSLNPKPIQVIVKEMLKENTAKNKLNFGAASSSASDGRLQISKGASEKQIRIAQTQYIATHKAQFSFLIADVKRRKRAAKEKADKKTNASKEKELSPNSDRATTADESDAVEKNSTSNPIMDPISTSAVNILPSQSQVEVQNESSDIVQPVETSRHCLEECNGKLASIESTVPAAGVEDIGRTGEESLLTEDENRDMFESDSPQPEKPCSIEDVNNADMETESPSISNRMEPPIIDSATQNGWSNEDKFSVTSSYNSLTFQTQKSNPAALTPEEIIFDRGQVTRPRICEDSRDSQTSVNGENEPPGEAGFDVMHGMTEDADSINTDTESQIFSRNENGVVNNNPQPTQSQSQTSTRSRRKKAAVIETTSQVSSSVSNDSVKRGRKRRLSTETDPQDNAKKGRQMNEADACVVNETGNTTPSVGASAKSQNRGKRGKKSVEPPNENLLDTGNVTTNTRSRRSRGKVSVEGIIGTRNSAKGLSEIQQHSDTITNSNSRKKTRKQ